MQLRVDTAIGTRAHMSLLNHQLVLEDSRKSRQLLFHLETWVSESPNKDISLSSHTLPKPESAMVTSDPYKNSQDHSLIISVQKENPGSHYSIIYRKTGCKVKRKAMESSIIYKMLHQMLCMHLPVFSSLH